MFPWFYGWGGKCPKMESTGIHQQTGIHPKSAPGEVVGRAHFFTTISKFGPEKIELCCPTEWVKNFEKSENQSHQIQNSQKNSHDQFHYQVNPFPIHDQNLTFSETWWGQHRPRLFQIRRCSFAAVATVSWFTIHHLVMVETPGRFVRSEFPMAQLWSCSRSASWIECYCPGRKHSLSHAITIYHGPTSDSSNVAPEIGAKRRRSCRTSFGRCGDNPRGTRPSWIPFRWFLASHEERAQTPEPSERRIVWCWNDPCDHPDHPVQWPWWPLNHHENQHYNIYIYITIIPYINILIYIYIGIPIYIYPIYGDIYPIF